MKLKTLFGIGSLALCLIGCGGGGSPSDMAQFEPGLVGQYELIELHGDTFDIIHQDGSARLGDMLLQDDNTFDQNFNTEAKDIVGYYEDFGNWSATLSTITFNGESMGYDTSKPDNIGADIGDTLTIDKSGTVFVWLKVTGAPRN